jgi:hypothetical protein
MPSHPVIGSTVVALAALGLLATVCGAQPAAPPAPAGSPRESAPPGGAQPAAPADPAQSPSASPSPPDARPVVEPEAIAALVRMGAYLRALPAFGVRAETSTDEVLDTGQKIQLDSVVDIRARRPDRLRADVVSERKQRVFYYDGTTLTLYAPRVKLYAAVPAPPTIRETIDMAGERLGLDLPLADLFLWGTERAPTGDITRADHLGPGRIDGVECDQFAFRQAGVDWQVWIQKGASPVPRKLVITTTAEPAQPQYIAVLRWELSPTHDEAMFTFVPPPDAQKIAIRERGAGKN